MVISNNVGPEEEQTIRGLVQEFDAAWNARDTQLFSSFFTEDGDMHFITLNMRMRGRDEVARTYTEIFSEMAPGSKHLTTLKEIHNIAPGVILLDVFADIVKSDA